MTFEQDFASILSLSGQSLSLYALQSSDDEDSWSSNPVVFLGVVAVGTAGEVILEAGYKMEDYITVYSSQELHQHDHISCGDLLYEVKTVQHFDLNGSPKYFKSLCRLLINQ